MGVLPDGHIASGDRGGAGGVLAIGKNDRLGANLREARRARGLTLDKLASMSDLTRGYLSLVERGLKTPSIAALVRISNALGVNIAQLFDQNATPAPQYSLYRREDGSKPQPGYGGFWLSPLAAGRTGKIMERFLMQAPLKSAARATHAGEEMLYVLSGEIGIKLGAEELLLHPGDCLYFSSETRHEVRSIGRQKAEVFVVIATPPN